MTDREMDGVTVLEIEGRIVLGEETNAFREKVKSLLAAGKKKIVLNLANVGYIDSAGLGTLVATFHSARSQGATLKLAHWGKHVKGAAEVHEAHARLRPLRQRTRRDRQLQVAPPPLQASRPARHSQ